MKTIRLSFLAVASVVVLASAASSQEPKQAVTKSDCGRTADGCLGQPRPMTLAVAKEVVAAAYKAACSPPNMCTAGTLAVTDDAGVLIYLETFDGTIAGVPELTIRKARTAAIWRRPTATFQAMVKEGRNIAYADGTFPDMTLAPGGIPLFVDGRCVGGFAHGGVGLEQNLSRMEIAAQETAEKLINK
jgi:uncharacterized protein GlcG (DUF336 family)